jgi:hypothetical protein
MADAAAPRSSDGGRELHASGGQGERERALRLGLWADPRRGESGPTLAGPRERTGSAHLGLRKARRGGGLVGPVGQKPRKRGGK